MIIRLLSDLHQEFEPYKVQSLAEDHEETILVLAGDIDIGTDACDFIIEQANNFAHVIYILGNHEFYANDLDTLAGEIALKLSSVSNISFLNNDSVVIGDIKFIGSTLWTDMNNENPVSMFRAEQSMNDYHSIRRNGYKILSSTTIDLFKRNMIYLDTELSKLHCGPTIVVTHHLPSYESVHPLYRDSFINGAYASNCEKLMYDHDISYWLHGHTHQTMAYEVNGCKVRMNPFGYAGIEENLNFDPVFRFEV